MPLQVAIQAEKLSEQLSAANDEAAIDRHAEVADPRGPI
jgi:hypothetical protein